MGIKQLTKLKAINNNQLILCCLMLILCLGVSGCAGVAPWERGILAKPHMAIIQNPLQTKVRAHIYSSREAGAPVNSFGGGGGCGCF